MKKFNVRLHQIVVIIKYIFYFVYCKIKKINNNDMWIISERGNEARDNGYSFYKFIKKEHKEINVKYIIDINSSDAKKIKNKEDIVEYGSKEHYILFLTAGVLASTHIMGFSPEFRLFTRLDRYNLVKLHGKRIFLQHGIIKDASPGLNKENVKLDMFVCGAKREYEVLLKTLNQGPNVLKYTGLARYDYLKSKTEKNILVMPTWRMKLFYHTDKFKETSYFKAWNGLLNNETLHQVLEKYNYKLIFYLHYEMQQYVSEFNTNSENILIADFEKFDVSDLLCKTSMLITDYSSVFFDVAYMRKPIIYYQFDYKEFRKEHYSEGYFNYIDDGFGKVITEKKTLIHEIDKILKSGCYVEEMYEKRRNNFFEYNDKQNCRRIYEEIVKLKNNI